MVATRRRRLARALFFVLGWFKIQSDPLLAVLPIPRGVADTRVRNGVLWVGNNGITIDEYDLPTLRLMKQEGMLVLKGQKKICLDTHEKVLLV